MLLMMQPVNALTLKGGVEYTVESAREEAFRNIEYQISMEPHKKYLKDPGYTPGEGGKKPKISKKGRTVSYFSDGSYDIRYYTNWKYIYIYNVFGKLKAVEIRDYDKAYPFVSYCYDTEGVLIEAALNVSGSECYVYDMNGILLAHWKGYTAYDSDGNVIMLRTDVR